MAEPRELGQLQNWLQAVITHPGAAAEGVQSSSAQEILPLPAGDVAAVIPPSSTMSGLERLDIYATAYWARLLECLRAEYPRFARAVGDELFDSFALEYLRQYPSRSYTLGKLGAHFAQFLADTAPEDGAPDETGSEEIDLRFLIDLARLEWAFGEVFDGPGVERVAPLSTAEIEGIAPDAWPGAKLACAPCLRLMRLDYPVQEYYRTLRTDAGADDSEPAPTPPEPGDTWLAITRRDYVVRHLVLDRVEHALLAAILRGETIGTAIAEAAELVLESDSPRFAAQLGAWFERWTTEQFFTGIALGGD